MMNEVDKEITSADGCEGHENKPCNEDVSLGDPSADAKVFKMPTFQISAKKKIISPMKDTSLPPNSGNEHVEEPKPLDSKIEGQESSKLNVPNAHKKSSKPQIPALNLADYYTEPMWGGVATKPYSLEVIKNGSVIDRIDLNKKSFYVFGRLATCDVFMEHPSLSRYHAILQHCPVDTQKHEEGLYLYDLESSHGTYVNKNRLKPRVYYRVKVGYMIKFAGSSRLYIVQGPDDDEEPESELTVAEIKEKRQQELKEMEEKKIAEEEAEKQREKERAEADQLAGCSWGFSEDATSGTVVDSDPEETEVNLAELDDELTLNDPKKSLKGFFEREGERTNDAEISYSGLEMPEYEFEELEKGKRLCHIELPIDKPNGECVRAEVMATGKKKDLVIQCALEACKLLHKYGMFKKANMESRKKRARDWEADDYYDSDDDTFMDRTGDIEKKRLARMKRAGKIKDSAKSYETLKEELEKVEAEYSSIESELATSKTKEAAVTSVSEVDALDAYMKSIRSGAMDAGTRMTKKRRLLELKTERSRLQKLVAIATPVNLPKPAPSLGFSTRTLPMSGRIHKSSPRIAKGSAVPIPTQPRDKDQDDGGEGEEEEEEEGDDTITDNKSTSLTKYGTVEVNIKQTAVCTNVDQTHIDNNETENSEIANTNELSKSAENISDRKSTVERNTGNGVKRKSADTINTAVAEKVQKTAAKSNKGISAFVQRATNEENLKTKKKSSTTTYTSGDPDYDVWVPPADQTGDGETHLNAKYGY